MSNYSDKILADTPLAYWRMDAASGNLTDLSGNSKTATAAGTAATYGTVSLVPNENDSSITFADNDNRFTAGDDADFELQTFSIEAWVLATGVAAANSGSIIIAKQTGAITGWILGIMLSGGNYFLSFAPRGGAGIFAGLTYFSQISLNTAYHVVATTTPTSVRVYVNGVLVVDSTRSVATTYSTESVLIGNGTSNDWGFVGKIDEVAFYAYELTAAQVKSHYDVSNNWGVPQRSLLPSNRRLIHRPALLLPGRRTLI